MSYSFNIRGATAAALVAALPAKFDEVVVSQPVHSNDRDQAIAAATAMVGIVSAPPEGQELSVSVSGSLSWRSGDGLTEAYEFTGAGISVHVSTVSLAT